MINSNTYSGRIDTSYVCPTVKARGQVDKWLAELEIQMRLSLRQQIENALEQYAAKDVTESITAFPNQVPITQIARVNIS